MTKTILIVSALSLGASTAWGQAPALRLNSQEYFEMPGVNVMAFQDIYPEGHQAGVNLIQHGVRVASNGDLRLDPVPGQWQPMPKQDKRVANQQANEIVTWLSYPADQMLTASETASNSGAAKSAVYAKPVPPVNGVVRRR